MAWIYSLESEESHSPSSRGCDQSPTVKSTDTVKVSCYPACPMDRLPTLPYGMTCGPCRPPNFRAWTSSQEASPARTSALQAMELAWMDSEAAFTGNSIAWSAKSGLDSSFWRTSQPLELEVFDKSSAHLPSSGTIVDGRVYPPQRSGLRIEETAGGSLLPTPSASNYGTNKGGAAGRVGKERPSLQTMAKRLGGVLDPAFVEWTMGYPRMWTVCEPWATPSSPPKRAKRSAG